MRCLSCKYDLRELSTGGEHRCPECGRIFDPKDPRTFLDPSKSRQRRWGLVLIVTAITYVPLLATILFRQYDQQNRLTIVNNIPGVRLTSAREPLWSIVAGSAVQALMVWGFGVVFVVVTVYSLWVLAGWIAFIKRWWEVRSGSES